MITRTMLLAAIGLLASSPLFAKSPVLQPVDFSSCANHNEPVNGPVGVSTGNAGTKFAGLNFTLLDGSKGNNSWYGVSGAILHITLSAPSPTAVYLLINSRYGQSGIPNATIVLKGTNKTHQTVKLIGNKTIRDYNNWVWTNTLVGSSTQEWWTNNLNPMPQDQSHREDAHKISTAKAFAGQTLTDIYVQSPSNAADNYMEPLLWAIGVQTSSGAITASCSAE